MKLNLGDIIPTSTLDWPGKVVLVVFTRGCPLRCPYCSNGRLIDSPEDGDTDIEYIQERIKDAADFIDGVVFSGGEPFMQPLAIKELASYAKGIGLLIGAHTNGAYPDRIGSMAGDGLLDAIFLDVKAPLEYEAYGAVGGKVDRATFEAIKRSVALCCSLRKSQKIRHLEIRTTVFRGISDKPSDIEKIAGAIGFADEYVIQQGRPEVAMDEKIKALDAVPRSELLGLAGAARNASRSIGSIKVRTHIFGDEIVG
jgi:pyruvate formate lyase activating enzyme